MGKDVFNLYFKAFQRTVSQICRTILPVSEPRDRYSDRRVFSAQKEMQECGNHWPFQSGASLVAQLVNNLPAMWETWVQSLGWGDPLKESLEATPVSLPGASPWTEEPGGLQSMGSQRVGHNGATFTSLHFTSSLESGSALENWLTWNLEFSSDVETFLKSHY